MPMKKVGKDKFQLESYDAANYGEPVGKPMSKKAAEKKAAMLKAKAKGGKKK